MVCKAIAVRYYLRQSKELRELFIFSDACGDAKEITGCRRSYSGHLLTAFWGREEKMRGTLTACMFTATWKSMVLFCTHPLHLKVWGGPGGSRGSEKHIWKAKERVYGIIYFQ